MPQWVECSIAWSFSLSPAFSPLPCGCLASLRVIGEGRRERTTGNRQREGETRVHWNHKKEKKKNIRKKKKEGENVGGGGAYWNNRANTGRVCKYGVSCESFTGKARQREWNDEKANPFRVFCSTNCCVRSSVITSQIQQRISANFSIRLVAFSRSLSGVIDCWRIFAHLKRECVLRCSYKKTFSLLLSHPQFHSFSLTAHSTIESFYFFFSNSIFTCAPILSLPCPTHFRRCSVPIRNSGDRRQFFSRARFESREARKKKTALFCPSFFIRFFFYRILWFCSCALSPKLSLSHSLQFCLFVGSLLISNYFPSPVEKETNCCRPDL